MYRILYFLSIFDHSSHILFFVVSYIVLMISYSYMWNFPLLFLYKSVLVTFMVQLDIALNTKFIFKVSSSITIGDKDKLTWPNLLDTLASSTLTQRTGSPRAPTALLRGKRNRECYQTTGYYLKCRGSSTYQLIRDLLAPTKPTDNSFDELVTLVKEHQQPVPSFIVQQCTFNSRLQQPGESMNTFIAQLRKIAQHCKFCAVYTE